MLEFFTQGVTYLLKNESYMYSTDRREWSSIVTYHPQNNCQNENQNEKPPMHAFFELKHENGIKTGKKYAPATLHSSDLSLGINCIFS